MISLIQLYWESEVSWCPLSPVVWEYSIVGLAAQDIYSQVPNFSLTILHPLLLNHSCLYIFLWICKYMQSYFMQLRSHNRKMLASFDQLDFSIPYCWSDRTEAREITTRELVFDPFSMIQICIYLYPSCQRPCRALRTLKTHHCSSSSQCSASYIGRS